MALIRYNIRTTVIALLLLPPTLQVSAQHFELLRFDEDYRWRKQTGTKLDDSLKFLFLNNRKNTFLSIGGEIRDELGIKINEDWLKNQGYNYSLLQRYSLHAALHTGLRLRFFVQLNTALESGSKYGPGPADEDQLNIQNLFAAYQLIRGPVSQLSVRVGRQEINYGSGRLISVRDGNNTRQYFTGAKLQYLAPGFTLDAFVFAADEVNFGLFDNRTLRQASLWGAYSNLKLPTAANLDLYYLGIRRQNARFEEGSATELRHTLAARYWRNSDGFSYNVESAYQFGKFGRADISAWTMAIELAYTFAALKFKPTFTLRNDYISGDKRLQDGKLQTFNPLYPKGGYFGFNPLIGPSNLIDIHPYLTLLLTDQLTLQGDLVFNWRYALQDGLYRPSGNFNTAGAGSAHRYIGSTYLLSAAYQFNKHLTFSCGTQYFRLGNFIKDSLPLWANSTYFNAQLAFKF